GFAVAVLLGSGASGCASSSSTASPPAAPAAPPAAQPAPAAAPSPAAATPAAGGAGAGAAPAEGAGGRGGPPPPPPRPAPAPPAPPARRHAQAGRSHRVGDGADAGPARRPPGRPLGRGAGCLEHAHDLDHAAAREGAWLDALGSGVRGQVRHSGQLQRL